MRRAESRRILFAGGESFASSVKAVAFPFGKSETRLTMIRMAESSPVRPEVFRKIAALARLRVPDAELSVWTRQLSRIVSYIDQLKEIPEEAFRARPPESTPLRADSASAGEGEEALKTNSPALLHGHGVVPRVVGGPLSEAGPEPQASLPPSVGPASKRELEDNDAR